jgi:hypothetical protein
MAQFKDLVFRPHSVYPGGVIATLDFPNGYGVSVVAGPDGGAYHGLYGTYPHTFELAVVHNNRLCYATAVTGDVLGYCTPEEVSAAMEQVAALPANEMCTHLSVLMGNCTVCN